MDVLPEAGAPIVPATQAFAYAIAQDRQRSRAMARDDNRGDRLEIFDLIHRSFQVISPLYHSLCCSSPLRDTWWTRVVRAGWQQFFERPVSDNALE